MSEACRCSHFAQAHGPYGCESCAEDSDVFADQCLGYQSRGDQMAHASTIYECPYCTLERCSSWAALEVHIQIYHPSAWDPFDLVGPETTRIDPADAR